MSGPRPVHFSGRTPPELEPNRLTALVDRLRAQGAPLVDLTESNPTAAGIELPGGDVAAALAAGAGGPYRPEPRGLPSARAAAAAVFAGRGAPVDPGRVVMTASTSEAYAMLFKLLCDPGDDVLVPRPSYPLFEQLARLEGVEARSYRLGPAPGFELDPDRVEVEIGPRTRAVVVVSPNNPTGQIASMAALAELSELCARRGLALVSDEVFAGYPADGHAPAPSALAAGGALRFALDGLSKRCGMPHLKLGWIAAAGPAAACDEALARLDHIADAALSASTPVMTALPRLLEIGHGVRAAIAARVEDGRRRAAAALAGGPVSLLPAAGGWTAVLALPPAIDEEALACELAARHGVLVHPSYYFDFDRGAHLVISLLPEAGAIERGLAAVRAAVSAAAR